MKDVSHQGVAALHRLRSAWLATRTSRINTLRGILHEIGFTIPVGAHHVVPRVESLARERDSELPDTLRPLLLEACREIGACEHKAAVALANKMARIVWSVWKRDRGFVDHVAA